MASTTSEDRTLFPEPGVIGGAQRGSAGLVSLFFLGVCAAVGIADSFVPIASPKLAGNEKREFEELAARAKITDGTRMQLIEKNMRITSRVRSLTATRYAFTLFDVFGEVNDTILLGPTKWMFSKVRLVQVEGTDEELAAPSISVVAATSRRMENRGVRWVTMPIPRKSVVAQDLLPKGIDPRPGVEDAVIEGLKRHGVEVVDLREILSELPRGEAYQPWDTHWAMSARVAAVLATLKAIGIPTGGPFHSTLTRVPDAPTACDLLYSAGITASRYLPEWIDPPKQMGLEFSDRSEALGPPRMRPETMPRLALVGSSFSTDLKQGMLFEHYLGEPVWNGSVNGVQLIENLTRFLAESRPLGLPSVLVYEFPVHHSLLLDATQRAKSLRASYTDVFVHEDTGPLSLFATLESAKAVLVDDGKPTGRWQIPSGKIATTGDGIVSVRITRPKASVESPDLVLNSRSFRMPIKFAADQRTMVAPIIGIDRGGETFGVGFGASSSAVDIDFVTDLDLETSLSLLSSIETDPEGRIVLRSDAPAVVTRGAGLVIRFTDAPRSPELVRITIRGTERSLAFEMTIDHGAVSALGISGLLGDKVDSVVIEGIESTTRLRVTSASLHRQLRAK